MTEQKSSLGKGEGEHTTALELEPLGMKAVQSFGVTGVDPVWKEKRDMARKVGKGQTGLNALLRSWPLLGTWSSTYRRFSKGSSRSGLF